MSNFVGFSEEDIKKFQNNETITTKDTKEIQLSKKKPLRSHSEYNKQLALETKLKSTSFTLEATTHLQLATVTNNEPKVDVVNREVPTAKPDLHNKQKLMEEQNRKRKELVVKALEDRTKRTLEEQQKLQEIQNEFKKLDSNLSADVKILRKQIEIASYDYMEAEKRYNKIEREFLDAKLYMHQKFEKKEMLTEHLSTIIEKNEERKAEKLTNLLNKLQIIDGKISPDTNITNSD